MPLALAHRRDLSLAGFARVAYGGEAVVVTDGADVPGAAGPVSEPSPPPLPPLDHLADTDARGVVFSRLAALLPPDGALPLARRVASLLEGPLPRVALDGQVAADEAGPLRLVLAGVDPDALAPADRGRLLGGSPCAAAFVADAALRGERRFRQAVALAALAVEGYRAPLGAYDAALAELWADEHEAEALRALRSWLRGAPGEERRAYQAPVSYRIIPRVLGQVRRAVADARRAAEALLPATGVTGLSPVAWRVLGGLAVAWAELALVAERMVTAMNLSDELPPNLAVAGGPELGTYAYGWAASAFTEEARAAATPTALVVAGDDASADLLAPTFPAHRRQRRAAECADGALTILAVVASQALAATGGRPAPALEPVLAAVRRWYPPIDESAADRILADDAAALQRAVSAGELLDGQALVMFQ